MLSVVPQVIISFMKDSQRFSNSHFLLPKTNFCKKLLSTVILKELVQSRRSKFLKYHISHNTKYLINLSTNIPNTKDIKIQSSNKTSGFMRSKNSSLYKCLNTIYSTQHYLLQILRDWENGLNDNFLEQLLMSLLQQNN